MLDTRPPSEALGDLDALARRIAEKGLAAPAVLFLEMYRPLAHLSSQFLVVGSPLLAGLVGLDRFQQLRAVLADDARYNAFLTAIERQERLLDGKEA